jgi:hypothetical protein
MALQPEPLTFPLGVRFPTEDEFPLGYEAEQARIASAHITTGYVVNASTASGYRAAVEANVHAPQLWTVFRAVAEAILPTVAAPIIGVKDEEPTLGPYTDRTLALNVFTPHVHLLQNDGFLEFGVIFQHQGQTEEVFVPSPKFLRIWTNQEETVRRVLEMNGIPEVPTLQFIDEYAMVSDSIRSDDGDASWPDVVDALKAAFETLPTK